MDVYRCRLCGETHLGLGPISNCPFCGAHGKYMVKLSQWREENEGLELSEISKNNLEIALDVEVGNTSFYKSASSKAQSSQAEGIFKRLSKVENEHASTIAKILGVSTPPLLVIEASDDDKENYKESFQRESKAIEHYSKSTGEATEPRIKEVFSMLVEIESDHLKLDKQKLGLII